MHKPESRGISSRDPRGLLAIAAAATLWAIAAAVARRLFDRGIDPLALAASRSMIAMVGLGLLPAAWKKPEKGRLFAVIALGLSITAVNAVYYLAIQRLDVAVALVLQYTAPALVVAWAAFILKRGPDRNVLGALLATFVGVVLVSDVLSGVGELDALGVVFGLASAVLFAAYTLLSEQTGAIYGVIGALFRGFVAAAVLWTLFFIERGFPEGLTRAANLPLVLFVGIAGTLFPFLLFLWGVQRVRSERAAIAATLEPIVAAGVAWIWLSQVLTVTQLAGGVIVLAAILSLQRRGQIAAPEP
jgi:drug/metabolite transporter (DMT)-like permease